MVVAVFSILVGMVVSDVKTQQTVVFFFLIYFSYAISVVMALRLSCTCS